MKLVGASKLLGRTSTARELERLDMSVAAEALFYDLTKARMGLLVFVTD
jgi:hypothetical protein